MTMSLPHRSGSGCKTGLPSKTLPATRPCLTVTLQSITLRLERLENCLGNVARLHRKELMQRYGISECTFHRWVRAGRLPPPATRICGPLWRITDIEAAELAGQLPCPKSA